MIFWGEKKLETLNSPPKCFFYRKILDTLITKRKENEKMKIIYPLLVNMKIGFLPLVNDAGKEEIKNDLTELINKAYKNLLKFCYN